jgi:hypothetical protein
VLVVKLAKSSIVTELMNNYNNSASIIPESEGPVPRGNNRQAGEFKLGRSAYKLNLSF